MNKLRKPYRRCAQLKELKFLANTFSEHRSVCQITGLPDKKLIIPIVKDKAVRRFFLMQYKKYGYRTTYDLFKGR